ncbi:MAG: hypothetical protein HY556_06160 [Euryarchaeota archaeon]|nr:hypothetical protein [Euryarchaeota archaeon]
MGTDSLIAVVGAILLVAGMGYTYVTESPPQTGSFPVTWATRAIDGPVQEGRTDARATSQVSVPVTVKNLSRAVFILEWSDEPLNAADPDNPNDQFRLKVTSPDGAMTNEQVNSQGTIQIIFPEVNVIPASTSESAGSRSEAESNLATKYTGTRGLGTWRLEIEDREPGDAAAQGVTVVQDTGNGWRLRSQFVVYEPVF